MPRHLGDQAIERNKAIFDLWKVGWTQRQIGDAFGMHPGYVSQIVGRQIYAYARLHLGLGVVRRTDYRALKRMVRDHATERLAS